ncbi:MAG: GNAT family N-acetyltransferase [Spirochaetaceae bacterium]|jgi:GNAT superfamily N-acetyltransferase|nr:GNAT family N-acetyltransferase [Spirochaetaceae bacterium]
MGLIPCPPRLRGDLLSLLHANRKTCAAFLERAEASGGGTSGEALVFLDDGIRGALFAAGEGALFHCLPHVTGGDFRAAAAPLLSDFFARRSPYCMLGDLGGTRFLGEFRRAGSLLAAREYVLMEAVPPVPEAVTPPVAECTPEDAEALFPLRRAYELEEVYPPGLPFSEEAMRKNLSALLASRRVLGIPRDDRKGEFAAMGVINGSARGIIQIGGMFTLGEFRSRGYARAIAGCFARRALNQGMEAVLFAGTSNTPAIRAYSHAGFVPCGGFGINYYAAF